MMTYPNYIVTKIQQHCWSGNNPVKHYNTAAWKKRITDTDDCLIEFEKGKVITIYIMLHTHSHTSSRIYSQWNVSLLTAPNRRWDTRRSEDSESSRPSALLWMVYQWCSIRQRDLKDKIDTTNIICGQHIKFSFSKLFGLVLLYLVEWGASTVECRTHNREIPGSNPLCYRFKLWAFSFPTRRPS